jgi:hypothetical protein
MISVWSTPDFFLKSKVMPVRSSVMRSPARYAAAAVAERPEERLMAFADR